MALPIPKGRQKEVVGLAASGHYVILGAAGCGKTTLALLRSAFLADESTDHHGKTLLVTFNRTLVAYLKHFDHPNLRNVTIENYHAFARGYLGARGRLGRYDILDKDTQRKGLVQRASIEVGALHGPAFSVFKDKPIEIIYDELRWLAQNGVETSVDYNAIAPSQKSCIPADCRDYIFAVLEKYKELRSAAGKKFDWDDLSGAVCEEFDRDNGPRMYKHVVIDEGQDFSPQMIRSLVKAIPPDGTVTFFGDMIQQIYGHRISWRTAGLTNPRIWEFQENYRNTKQIAQLALEITRMPYYQGVADTVLPKAPSADGPLPELVSVNSLADEIAFVSSQARTLSRTQSVAILFRDHETANLYAASLPTSSIKLTKDLTTWDSKPGIWYGTFHSAKGLEFDTVIIPSLNESYMPKPDLVEAFGVAEASATDGRLLYVGVTRAKTQLIMSFTETLTPLIPHVPLYNVRSI